MTRTTSAEAYKIIKRDGLLSRARWEAYDIASRFGPASDNELRQAAQADGCHSFEALDGLGKRYSELRDMGVLCEEGTRICKVSGKRAIVWAVSGELPRKLAKRQTRAEQVAFLEKQLRQAQAEIVRMASELATLRQQREAQR